MPTIPTTDIFPSAKLIATDANGDLQEVVASPPQTAEVELLSNKVKVVAANAGADGNLINVALSDNNGNGADAVTVTGNAISVELDQPFAPADAGVADSLIYNGYLTLTAKTTGVSNIQLNIIDNVDNGFAVAGVAAEGSVGGLKLTAVATGVAGNNISLQIDEGSGAGSDTVTVTGSKITVEFDGLAADSDTSVLEGLINGDPTASALVTASGGDTTACATLVDTGISTASDFVAGVDQVADQDVVKISASDSDINVCLANNQGTYTNSSIKSLLTDSTAAWFTALDNLVTIVEDAAQSGNAIATGSFSFSGGRDPANQSHTVQHVVDLINNSTEASALVTASVLTGGSDLPSAISATNLLDGRDQIISDLDASSDYVCIKVSDIHSLLPSEIADGRKLFWGVLESYTQVATGLSAESQPENLIVTRGQPALVIDAAGTRIRQAYSIQSFYATGDFDLEDETSV